MILEMIVITEAFVIVGLVYQKAIHKCASVLIIQGEAKAESVVVLAEDNMAVIGKKIEHYTDSNGKIQVK